MAPATPAAIVIGLDSSSLFGRQWLRRTVDFTLPGCQAIPLGINPEAGFVALEGLLFSIGFIRCGDLLDTPIPATRHRAARSGVH